jgi:uncharacterized protein (DUF362 family)
MSISRREYLQAVAGVVAGASFLSADTGASTPGMPGAYRGKVVAVKHNGCIRKEAFQAEPIRAMVSRGMCELTGATDQVEAWRGFFSPGDVVGIKMSPVGQPFVCSSPEMLNAIIAGVVSAGIKPTDIIVYERYRSNVESTGLDKWLPPGVRIAWAAPEYSANQMGIEGYDPDHFVELPFVMPGESLTDPKANRSFAATFVARDINKLINVPSLKSHNAAGVTLALKSLSHGLVNNVNRSHDGPALRISEFIPAVVSMPVIRQKTVLNILDGTKGVYHGGPGIMNDNFVWEHKTAYFATDPVAMDIVGRDVIDAQRKKNHLKPVAAHVTDDVWKSPNRQPDHIESAGKAGLGEWDPAKINLKSVQLG